MKYNYPPLGGICGKAIKNNLCNGCGLCENPNFKGKAECDLMLDPQNKIKQILGIQEKIKCQ